MRNVSLSDLDAALAYVDEGYAVSHDEAYRRFGELKFVIPSDFPQDPFSPEYRARWLEMYRTIAGRDLYTPDNEKSTLDLDGKLYRPFPYYTKSLKLASIHYSLMAQLFEVLDLPENFDVLECGFGWGNTTLALAMMGHNVTGIDIADDFCELVRRRATLLKVDNVQTINADFLWVETTAKKFDAVIFFEPFHH